MNLKKLAEDTVSEIDQTLPGDLSDEQFGTITKIIENALVDAVGHTSRSCREAAVVCCGPEADLAHKIEEKVRLTKRALIANLMGPR